jgi:hypothetical protein
MKPRDYIICATLLIIYVLVTGCKSVTPVAPVATNAPPVVTAPMPPAFILTTNKAVGVTPPPASNTVVALVWSNQFYMTPTNFYYWIPQQSSDMRSWTNLPIWWFAEIHQTVELVTNPTATMFFRLVGLPALPYNPALTYPLGVISNGQGLDSVQESFASELATNHIILTLNAPL